METYTGATEPTLKTRVQGHFTSFRYEKYRHSTRLSRYIHSLKDNDQEYSIDWKIIDKQKAFSSISNTCRLCLAECYHILYGDQLTGKMKCGVIAGIPNDLCSPLQRCLRSRYPNIYTQPGRGPNFLAIVRNNYVFIMSIVISNCNPIFFLPSVADDPFGETDCSTME